MLIGFSGGPSPHRGLVLGRGSALFRVVRLGGHKVRKARGNVSNVGDDAGVFLYRDSSTAPLLDMRRRFSAVFRVELASQWYKVSAIGPSYPITRCDLVAVRGLGIGEFHGVVSGLHQRLCDFMRLSYIVVMMLFVVAELDSGGSFNSSL